MTEPLVDLSTPLVGRTHLLLDLSKPLILVETKPQCFEIRKDDELIFNVAANSTATLSYWLTHCHDKFAEGQQIVLAGNQKIRWTIRNNRAILVPKNGTEFAKQTGYTLQEARAYVKAQISAKGINKEIQHLLSSNIPGKNIVSAWYDYARTHKREMAHVERN